jgi:carbon monoxide dehydrogenase subunit G
MHFEGEFKVPGKPADVIRRFSDVPRMAGCMPGAVLEPQAEDGSWPGGMVVAFGPKKIRFKGKATVDFDFDALTGSVHGRGAADMRAARIGVKVAFALRDDPDAATETTIVRIVSDAELGGVLADFARTGGIAVANVIMADFAKRAALEFAKDDVAEVAEAVQPAAATAPEAPVTSVSEAPAASATAVAGPPGPLTEPQEPAARPASPPPPAAPLQAGNLIWVVIQAYLARVGRFFGIGR